MESFNCGFSIKDTDTVDEIKIIQVQSDRLYSLNCSASRYTAIFE